MPTDFWIVEKRKGKYWVVSRDAADTVDVAQFKRLNRGGVGFRRKIDAEATLKEASDLIEAEINANQW